MKAPPGIAKFDSASAMVRSLSRFLHGRDFAGLGQPAWLQALARRADWLPRRTRERVFAWLGAQEAVSPRHIERADADAIAGWLAQQYPQRRYPAIAIGSSNGALNHLYAALGIPWLPQTFLTLVDQTHVHPDDPVHAMWTEYATAKRFLRANPQVQLHHLHDPNQDRLMIGLITYYRAKFLRLPSAYRQFIEQWVVPGGTLLLIECRQRWPTTRLGERHLFQFGAVGGATIDDYFDGSPAVAECLRHYGSPVERWHPPRPNGDSAEAEWGFEAALRDDVAAFAERRGLRVVRICFDEPEATSALVADFHRAWYRRRGIAASRLLIESFVVAEPYWALRTGTVPYWMVFNMRPSLQGLHRYLDRHADDPWDELLLTLFAHGADAVGLPSIDEWQALLQRARRNGRMLGIDPRTYPAHFAHLGRYSQALREAVPARHRLPPALPLDAVEDYVVEHGARYGVQWLDTHAAPRAAAPHARPHDAGTGPSP